MRAGVKEVRYGIRDCGTPRTRYTKRRDIGD
jgi:hypothetical protein